MSENAATQSNESSHAMACSDALRHWPRKKGQEHTLESLSNRLRWQIGDLNGPCDFTFADDSKLDCRVQPIRVGSTVFVEWYEEIEDTGYILTLPGLEGNDCHMAGVVHFPSPSNNGGKGDIPPLWFTLDELLRVPEVKAIRVI